MLNKEENWKLLVPEELRERVICDAHSSPARPILELKICRTGLLGIITGAGFIAM